MDTDAVFTALYLLEMALRLAAAGGWRRYWDARHENRFDAVVCLTSVATVVLGHVNVSGTAPGAVPGAVSGAVSGAFTDLSTVRVAMALRVPRVLRLG